MEEGAPHHEVGMALTVYHIVATRAWAMYQQKGTPIRRHGGNICRATSATDDRYLVVQLRRNRFATANQLRSDYQNALDLSVTTLTVRTRLLGSSLDSRKPCIRNPLSPDHCRRRLTWALNHGGRRISNWRSVIFTDESRYCLDYRDRRVRVWKRPRGEFSCSKFC